MNTNKKEVGETDWCFSTNTTYEFTINLNDAYQVKGSSLATRYKNARKTLRELLMENKGLRYKLLPEVTMPQFGDKYKNTYPRIHFHGILQFSTKESIIHWLLEDAILCAKIGRYQFNIYRPDHWPTYCEKHRTLFKHITNQYYELTSLHDQSWPLT